MSAEIHTYLNELPRSLEKNILLKTTWGHELQQRALDKLNKIKLPNHHQEAWKYTATKNLQQKSEISAENHKKNHGLFEKKSINKYIKFVNGVLVENHTSIAVIDLHQFHREEMIKKFFEVSLDKIQDGFSALNLALLNQGYIFHVKENLSEPIFIYFCVDSENDTSYHFRNFVICEPNINATLIENYFASNQKKYLTNVQTDIYLEKNSKLTLYKIQQESDQAFHIGQFNAHLKKSSSFKSTVFTFGGAVSRSAYDVTMAEEHAECIINGLYFTKTREQADHYLKINHQASHTKSSELFKGIITEQSRAAFTGAIQVQEHAKYCDASQTNKNLLLSKKAEVDTRPQLEIYNDDVKCSHGSAIGNIDETALFYLMSRGILEQDAREILLQSFVSDVIDQIEESEIKKYITSLMAERMKHICWDFI